MVRVHSSSCPEQLTLENGQLIVILSKNASGWWLGELQVSVDGSSDKSGVVTVILIQRGFFYITVAVLHLKPF